MTRRCSHCGNDGHNLRTCPNKVVKVFGVRFDKNQTAPMRKSVSMENLSQHVESGGASGEILSGYASDGFDHDSSRREKKKGMAWTKEEHKHFLLGLEVFGKGDWRGIARAFVPSRTPTQVASHAQKYFNRLNHHQILRRRRFSVFDMALEELDDARTLSVLNQEKESGADDLTTAAAAAPPPPEHLETMLMDKPMSATNVPSIVKPTAVHCTSSTNLNVLVGMTTLDLFEKGNESSASAHVDIVPNSNSHSAFHSRSSPIRDGSGSPINLNLSPIHAV